MPFKSPVKKGQKRRVVLRFTTTLTDTQRKNFKKGVMSLAKRFKARVVR